MAENYPGGGDPDGSDSNGRLVGGETRESRRTCKLSRTPPNFWSIPASPPTMNSLANQTRLRSRSALVGALVTSLLATASFGQERERRPEGRGEGRGEGPPARMNPLFAALDANGDGVIDADEIKRAPELLKKLDRNGDGRLSEDEVRPAFGRGGPGAPGGPGGGRGGPGGGGQNVDEIVARLLQFDRNGDGKLSKDELPERMAAMMERGDTNKDGFLSREELTELAKAQAAASRREGDRHEPERH